MFMLVRCSCLVYVVALSVLSGEVAFGAEPNFPLVCRGGQMQVKFRTDPGGVKRGVQRVKPSASFCFKPAQGSAQRVGLHPGECGWVDRAFRNGEPRCVCEVLSGRGTEEVTWLLEPDAGHQVNRGGRPVPYLGYVTNTSHFSFLRDPQKYWTFQVSIGSLFKYPTSPRCLMMKSYGPGPVVPAPTRSTSAPRSQSGRSATGAAYIYTARLATTAKVQGNVVATGIGWKCRGNTCTTARTLSDPSPGVKTCNALARQVGKIVSYGHYAQRLTTSELARCNEGAAPALKVTPATPSVLPQIQSKDLTR